VLFAENVYASAAVSRLHNWLRPSSCSCTYCVRAAKLTKPPHPP
jgi:hypothetical protein